MVRLSKPAQHREVFFTDKTGGDNNDVDSSGKNIGSSAGGSLPETQANGDETGGAVTHYATDQLIGMRKGSRMIRGVAAKGCHAVWMVFGSRKIHKCREIRLSNLAGWKERGVLYWVAQKVIQQLE